MSASDSLSFDGLVALYDETRCVDEGCFRAALDYLADRFPARPDAIILEGGIGTGRIALPLAARGYRVAGVDLSAQMLQALRSRISRNARRPPPVAAQADIAELPFPDERFDMAVAAHVFYFVGRWRRAAEEILRVTRKGRPVVLIHTGTGMEIPSLNERYKELCAGMGCPFTVPGAEHTKEVTEYYRSLGCRVEWVRDRWRWTAKIEPNRAVEYIRRRAYSFTVPAPEDIHRAAVRKLDEQAKSMGKDGNAAVEIPNQITLAIVQKPGSRDYAGWFRQVE